MAEKKFNALPGFGLTMGYTLLYLSLIVLIPVGGLFLRVFEVCGSSPRLVAESIADVPDLATRLRQQGDPVSSFLWERLSDSTRRRLAANVEPAADSRELAAALVTELNQVIAGDSIYDQRRFAGVTLSEKSQWLLRHEAGAKSAGWLNRSLLENAFPSLITKKSNWLDLWLLATSARAFASYRLTFGASFIAAVLNAAFGTLLAWVLVRYEFPGKRFLDALVDFPFALPTAVAGLTLASLFAMHGWLGRFLVQRRPDGQLEPITLTYPMIGVVIALTFIGLPFVVRTLQPVLENFELEVEEAAATLGAGRLRTFLTIVAPTLSPAILTGFALAFARAIGEYGSVIFIASNKPFESEITPLLITIRLDEYDYTGAMALAVVLLVASFVLLITINLLERWASRYQN